MRSTIADGKLGQAPLYEPSLGQQDRRGGATATAANRGQRPPMAVAGGGTAHGAAQPIAPRPPARPVAPHWVDPSPSHGSVAFSSVYVGVQPVARGGGHRVRPSGTTPAAEQPSRVGLPKPTGPGAATNANTNASTRVPHQPLDALSGHAVAQYKRLNLANTPATRPAFRDKDVIEGPSNLAAGRFNTVYSVKLRGPDGEKLDRVFKPLAASERGWVAGHTGIDLNNPQVAMRNLATLKYAKKLGFDVIPDTKLALLTVPQAGTEGPQPQLGLVMERAPGPSAQMGGLIWLRHPEVAREVTKLQLLDHLTGQGDRHPGNYHVHIDAQKRAKVTGIDNDQCFGRLALTPDATRYASTADRHGFRGTGLPKYIDSDMAQAIKRITPQHLHEMFDDMLSQAEVQAAVKRLEGVQAHVAQLEQQGNVHSPQQWQHRYEKTASPSWSDGYAQRDFLASARHLRISRAAL